MAVPLVLDGPRAIPGTSVLLGESPVWDPRTARLRWVDLFDGPRHHTDPITGEDREFVSARVVGRSLA